MTIKESATRDGKTVTVEIDDRTITIIATGGNYPVLDRANTSQVVKDLNFLLTIWLYDPKITEWNTSRITMVVPPEKEFTTTDKYKFATGLAQGVLPFVK